MSNCPKCGAALIWPYQFCSVCGQHAIAPQPVGGKRPWDAGRILAWILIAAPFIAVAVAVIWFSPSSKTTSTTDRAVIRVKTPCAAKELAEAEILSAASHRDEAALEGLFDRGAAVMLEPGTQVDRIFEDDTLTAVRVNSGYYIDRTCWVANVAIQ